MRISIDCPEGTLQRGVEQVMKSLAALRAQIHELQRAASKTPSARSWERAVGGFARADSGRGRIPGLTFGSKVEGALREVVDDLRDAEGNLRRAIRYRPTRLDEEAGVKWATEVRP